MPTSSDINLGVINSMTEAELETFKNASGKYPSLANQLVMTDEEDDNIDMLRCETVYDMRSSDNSINWGYTSGIQGGVTVSGKDFSKYDKLKIYLSRYTTSYTSVMDLNNSNGDGYASFGICGTVSSGTQYITTSILVVNSAKTSFNYSAVYQSTASKSGDSGYIVYKIVGILKQPALIYTGDELNAGTGISISGNTISATGVSIEVIYDMSSPNSNINWGYTNGIENNINITGKNFSKYKKLLFTCANFSSGNTDANCSMAIMDLNIKNSSKNRYECSVTTMINRSSVMYGDSVRIYVGSTKTEFTAYMMEYTTSGSYTASDLKIIKIEGVV